MSLLKSIKGTIKTVQEDLSEGLKSLTTTEKSVSATRQVQHQQSKKINYDAGGDMLHKNELLWKDLYSYSEETAKKAQDVDVEISRLLAYFTQQSQILSRLQDEAASLPILLTQLQDITNSLAHVEEECDKVEAGLVHLENICEEQDFRRNMASHHKQLAAYKMKKEYELQRYKVQLAKEHAEKVDNFNKKQEHLLHERQSAFHDQFTQDLDYFKKHGEPARIPLTPESAKKLDLGDIEIEEDIGALDAFLESSTSDTTQGDTKDNSDADVLSDSDAPVTEVTPEITSPSEEISPPPGVAEQTDSSTVNTEKTLESTEETTVETQDKKTSQTSAESDNQVEPDKRDKTEAVTQ